MNEAQLLDNWITNYQAVQRHKHAQFLKALKHEFTRQQRRDRLDKINTQQIQGLLLQASSGNGRTTAANQGKEA